MCLCAMQPKTIVVDDLIKKVKLEIEYNFKLINIFNFVSNLLTGTRNG